MNGMRAHLRLTGTALATSVPLLAPAAAHAARADSTAQGGWGWWDAVIWGGALVGIVLLGFFGDRVVGAVIFGIWAVLGGGAALVANAWQAVRTRVDARTESRRESAASSLRVAPERRQPG